MDGRRIAEVNRGRGADVSRQRGRYAGKLAQCSATSNLRCGAFFRVRMNEAPAHRTDLQLEAN